MNIAIQIIGHADDDVAEREHLLPEGTTNFLVDLLADAGIVVDDIHADVYDPDEWGPS